LAEVAGTELAPREPAPAFPAYWPVLGALGVTLVAVGLVVSTAMFLAGFVLLLVALIEWTVLAWSDRATGDVETNRLVRDRVMGQIEVPVIGLLIAGGGVFAFSRMLLSSSEMGSVAVAAMLGVVVLALGVLFATKPRISANVVAGIRAMVAITVVGAGVVSAARGERTIEKPEITDTGNHTYVPPGTQAATTTTVAAG
jgi:hypothetical protein